MNQDISKFKLIDFVGYSISEEIDFAKYVYMCGAHRFVERENMFNPLTKRKDVKYKFKEYILNECSKITFPLYVISIPKKSYLMYEVSSSVSVWVCYTEETHRKLGYMELLLKELMLMYPEKTISIDTCNLELKRKCSSLGITIFKK